VQLAAPVLVFSLVFNLATGLVGRVMPQFQIFFVASPLSVLLGLSLLRLSPRRHRHGLERPLPRAPGRLQLGRVGMAEETDDASKTEEPTAKKLVARPRQGRRPKTPTCRSWPRCRGRSAWW
jgi:hypothetical protein